MYIVKIEKPLWTWQHLEHYLKYQDVYGFELTALEIERERDMLKCGLPGRRYAPEVECYDIYAETGELAGDIILTQSDLVPEVSIVVFDQFSGQGFAKRALRALIDLITCRFKKIEAVVKSDNPAICKARYILEGVGFTFECNLPGGGLLFVLYLSDN